MSTVQRGKSCALDDSKFADNDRVQWEWHFRGATAQTQPDKVEWVRFRAGNKLT